MTNDEHHAAATHKSDRELWLKAHHGATAFTLEPGQMLTREQRERAWEMVWENDQQDERERAEARCRP